MHSRSQVGRPTTTTRRNAVCKCAATVALLLCVLTTTANAQFTDPLGNELPIGSGTPIYEFESSYARLGGSSSLLRDKQFRERTDSRNYITFDIRRPGVRHLLTVGNFPSKFSYFTLNKELFDAIRWSITIPKARGTATGFMGRLTNNTFDDAGAPREDQRITSTGDWFMAGFRAEANLGAGYLRLGQLPEITLPFPQLGVNFVHRFFTNYDLSRTTNPFQGVVVSSPPTALYIRFRDDSPEDGAGAKLYRLRMLVDGEARFDFTPGREPPGLLVQPTTSRALPDGSARVADGEATFTYRLSLIDPQDSRSVEFALDLANDYLVELSTDGVNFQRQLQANGNVKDESNRAVQRFHYGELADETTFGVDLQTTMWGFAVEAERAWYSRTLQYPIFDARRTQSRTGAWFLDVNRRFGPLFWQAEYTKLDPFYTATNFVDDNDNDDPFLDAREPSVPFAGSDRDDKDRDGIKDWDDDFLLFFADPPEFVRGLDRESMDFNNNGVPDNLEDDEKPNYRLDYDEGTHGFSTYFALDVPAAPGFSVIPGYYEKIEDATGKTSTGLYNILSYEPRRIDGFGTLRARHTLRRSRDEIPDDYIEGGRLVIDDLQLGDYIGNIFTLVVDYDSVEDLTIRTKFKYELNRLFDTRTREVDARLIHQLRYEYHVRDDLTIAPAFRSDRTMGYEIPERPEAESYTLRNAYLLTLTHQVAEELQLSAGIQYLTWRDYVESRNDYNRRVGFLELVLQGSFLGKVFGLVTTADFVSQSFLRPVGGDLRSTNISASLFYIRG